MGQRRTDAEIRRHRNLLLASRDIPCSCAKEGHATECKIGAMMNRAVAQALTWALGEGGAYQECVDNLERMMRHIREAN